MEPFFMVRKEGPVEDEIVKYEKVIQSEEKSKDREDEEQSVKPIVEELFYTLPGLHWRENDPTEEEHPAFYTFVRDLTEDRFTSNFAYQGNLLRQ